MGILGGHTPPAPVSNFFWRLGGGVQEIRGICLQLQRPLATLQQGPEDEARGPGGAPVLG